MTRWHGSTGQRRRTYCVSGRIASAFARLVVLFALVFAVSMREASAAACLHRLHDAMPVLGLSESNRPVESNRPIPIASSSAPGVPATGAPTCT